MPQPEIAGMILLGVTLEIRYCSRPWKSVTLQFKVSRMYAEVSYCSRSGFTMQLRYKKLNNTNFSSEAEDVIVTDPLIATVD